SPPAMWPPKRGPTGGSPPGAPASPRSPPGNTPGDLRRPIASPTELHVEPRHARGPSTSCHETARSTGHVHGRVGLVRSRLGGRTWLRLSHIVDVGGIGKPRE